MRKMLLPLAALLGVAVGLGTANASPSAVVASATDTVAAHGGGRIYLSSTGGVETPVASIALPAGKYVLSAAGNVGNFTHSDDYVRCQIVVGTTQVAANSTFVGFDPAASQLQEVSLIGAAVVPSGGATATLQCEHDTTGSSQSFWDNDGSLWAHRTASLKVAAV